MKFTQAWASVAKENVSLKIVALILAIFTVVFSLTSLRLALRDPIVVERGFEVKALNPVDAKTTNLEIKQFLKKALVQRFTTSERPNLLFLSYEQMALREKEQADLASKKIKQFIVINDISVAEDSIIVQADRLLSVADVRSALMFPLKVEVKVTHRSRENPYGLLLTNVIQIKHEVKK